MAKAKRILVQLECTVCKRRNYITEKNPDNAQAKGKAGSGKEKLLLKKYCRWDRKVTEHKEIKI